MEVQPRILDLCTRDECVFSFLALSLNFQGTDFCTRSIGGFIDRTVVLKNVESRNVSPEPGIEIQFQDHLLQSLIAIQNDPTKYTEIR